jgi:hypothetical protein
LLFFGILFANVSKEILAKFNSRKAAIKTANTSFIFISPFFLVWLRDVYVHKFNNFVPFELNVIFRTARRTATIISDVFLSFS